jgi:hypothetical protein
MKSIRIVLVSFFLFLLLLKFYFKIKGDYSSYPFFSGAVVLISFIVVLLRPSKVTWFIGMALFSYGLYYYLFMAVSMSSTGVMEFTYTLERLLFADKKGSFSRIILSNTPFLFYLGATIAFLTKPVRRQYFTTIKMVTVTV